MESSGVEQRAFHQRDELCNLVRTLQGQRRVLAFEIDYLEGKKEELEATIRTIKALTREILVRKLMIPKIQRPDLFNISDQEQIDKLAGEFLKWILA